MIDAGTNMDPRGGWSEMMGLNTTRRWCVDMPMRQNYDTSIISLSIVIVVVIVHNCWFRTGDRLVVFRVVRRRLDGVNNRNECVLQQ